VNEDGSNNNIVEIKARRIQFLNRQNKDESFLFEPVTEVTSEVKSDIPASANVENIEVVSTAEDKIKKQWFGF